MNKDIYEAMKLALAVLKDATPKYARQRKDQKELGGYLEYWTLSEYKRGSAIEALEKALKYDMDTGRMIEVTLEAL